jgi:hypothetical protein
MNNVDRFLDDFNAALRTGRRYRARAVAEIREHLADAVEMYSAAGHPNPDHLAVAAIGTPVGLADRFNAEAATRRLLRTPWWAGVALAALAGGVLIPLFGRTPRPVVAAPAFAQIVFFAATLAAQVAVVALGRGVSLAVALRRDPHPAQADETMFGRAIQVSIAASAATAVGWVGALLTAAHRGAISGGSTLVAGIVVIAIGVISAAFVVAQRTRITNTAETRKSVAPSPGSLFVGERIIGFVRLHPITAAVATSVLAAAMAMWHAETTLSGSLVWGFAEIGAVVAGFLLLGPLLGLRSQTKPGRVAA